MKSHSVIVNQFDTNRDSWLFDEFYDCFFGAQNSPSFQTQKVLRSSVPYLLGVCRRTISELITWNSWFTKKIVKYTLPVDHRLNRSGQSLSAFVRCDLQNGFLNRHTNLIEDHQRLIWNIKQSSREFRSDIAELKRVTRDEMWWVGRMRIFRHSIVGEKFINILCDVWFRTVTINDQFAVRCSHLAFVAVAIGASISGISSSVLNLLDLGSV